MTSPGAHLKAPRLSQAAPAARYDAPNVNLSVFSGQRLLIAVIAAFSILINLLILIVPLFMLQLFDRVLTSGSIETLAFLSLGALVGLVFFLVFEILRQRLLTRLGVRIEKRFNALMLTHEINSAHRGALQSGRALADLRQIRSYMSGPAFIALLDAPWSILYIALIFLFHPLLGVIALAGLLILLAIAIVGEILSRSTLELAREASIDADRKASAFLRNADVAHAMSTVGNLVRQWIRPSDASMSFSARAGDRIGTVSALAKFVRMSLQVIMLATGAMLVLEDQFSPGIMIAGSIILGRALAPVEQSISGWRSLVMARGALRRVRHYLSGLDDDRHKLPLPEPEAAFSVEAVSLVVPGFHRPVLANIGFELFPGEALGVIGPSGSGKSSLSRLLCGLDEPTYGDIRLDGAKLSSWPRELLGSYIGYLPQQVELLEGTVADNICLHDPDADPAEIVRAARTASVYDLILEFPDGFNTEVGSGGDRLSAGQRQLVALARTLYGNRKLIVLDEPNSNLDPNGEHRLARAIAEAKKRKCCIILITHRPAILNLMDKVLILDNGRVAKYAPASEILVPHQIGRAGNGRSHLSVVQGQEKPPKRDGRTGSAGLEAQDETGDQ